MLSGETAAGTYPRRSGATMHNIASRAETALDYRDIISQKQSETVIMSRMLLVNPLPTPRLILMQGQSLPLRKAVIRQG